MSEFLSNRDPADETVYDQTTIANLHDIIRERDREIERRTTARQEALDALHEQREMSVDREQSMVRAMLEAMGQDDIDPAITLDELLPLVADMADKVIALWPLARAATVLSAVVLRRSGSPEPGLPVALGGAGYEAMFALVSLVDALPPDLRAELEADHD